VSDQSIFWSGGNQAASARQPPGSIAEAVSNVSLADGIAEARCPHRGLAPHSIGRRANANNAPRSRPRWRP
jgi:hypothetical protein